MGACQLSHSVFQVSLCLGLLFTSAFPKHVLTSAVRLSLSSHHMATQGKNCLCPTSLHTPRTLKPSTLSYICSTTLNLFCNTVQEGCINSSVFIRNLTLIFSLWNSLTLLKYFSSLRNHPLVNGNK